MNSKQLAVFYRKAAGMLVAMLRKERDLTKLRIQEITNGEIKISHLSQFERGEKGFSKPKMKMLLDIFGMTPGTFEDRVEALLPEVISGEKKKSAIICSENQVEEVLAMMAEQPDSRMEILSKFFRSTLSGDFVKKHAEMLADVFLNKDVLRAAAEKTVTTDVKQDCETTNGCA